MRFESARSGGRFDFFLLGAFRGGHDAMKCRSTPPNAHLFALILDDDRLGRARTESGKRLATVQRCCRGRGMFPARRVALRHDLRHEALAFGDALDLDRNRVDRLLESLESLRRFVPPWWRRWLGRPTPEQAPERARERTEHEQNEDDRDAGDLPRAQIEELEWYSCRSIQGRGVRQRSA